MNENPTVLDWVRARGDKWRAHVAPMEATLRPIDAPLIQALELHAPSRIAEIGCGGGGTSMEILRRAPAGTVVHGLDISPSLIELARGRVRPDDGAVAFEVADMATATPERAYDRLASRFGVMFFHDPRAAFANLSRWLAPGGRLAFAVWGPPAENPWITRVRDAVAEIVPLPEADPEAPGPFRYADPDKLVALLETAGFGGLDVRDWRGALPIGGGLSPGDAASFVLSSFSNFGELLAKAGDDALGEARRSVTAAFSHHQRDGAVHMGACVRIVTGIRP